MSAQPTPSPYGYPFVPVKTPCGERFYYLPRDIGVPETWNLVILRAAISVGSPCCGAWINYTDSLICNECGAELPAFYMPANVRDLEKVLRARNCPVPEKCVGEIIHEVLEGCQEVTRQSHRPSA